MNLPLFGKVEAGADRAQHPPAHQLYRRRAPARQPDDGVRSAQPRAEKRRAGDVSNMGGISAQTGKRQGVIGAIVQGGVRDVAQVSPAESLC